MKGSAADWNERKWAHKNSSVFQGVGEFWEGLFFSLDFTLIVVPCEVFVFESTIVRPLPWCHSQQESSMAELPKHISDEQPCFSPFLKKNVFCDFFFWLKRFILDAWVVSDIGHFREPSSVMCLSTLYSASRNRSVVLTGVLCWPFAIFLTPRRRWLSPWGSHTGSWFLFRSLIFSVSTGTATTAASVVLRMTFPVHIVFTSSVSLW